MNSGGIAVAAFVAIAAVTSTAPERDANAVTTVSNAVGTIADVVTAVTDGGEVACADKESLVAALCAAADVEAAVDAAVEARVLFLPTTDSGTFILEELILSVRICIL